MRYMGRHRKAWLWHGTGVRTDRGRRLPGYYARWHDYLPGGRRVNRSRQFAKHADAAEWVRQRNARATLGELGQIVPIPLREAVAEFLAALSPLAPDTRTHYASALGMLAGIIGDPYISAITGQTIERFVSIRLKRSRPATVAKHLRGLHRFFVWAHKCGYASTNPLRDLSASPFKAFVAEKPSIGEHQLATLIDNLDTDDRRIAVWVALTSGMDRGTIMRLLPSQIDLAGRVFRVVRGKTHKLTALPIHPALVRPLAELLRQRPPDRPLLRGLTREHKPRDWWYRATQAAGLPGFQFRWLRAVASSRLQVLGGASLRAAQALLGHASPTTTAAHYSLPDPEAARALAKLPLPGARRTSKRSRPKRVASARRA